MKQFDLEEYLANPSKKVVTRDGHSVRIRCTDKKGTIYPVVGLVDIGTREITLHYTRKGENWISKESDRDIFFAPEKHEGWVNIYKAGAQRETLGCLATRYAGSSIWPTEEEAKTAADPDPIATIKIEWEE